MSKWDYYVATFSKNFLGQWSWDDGELKGAGLIAGLDAYGSVGWELVAVAVIKSDNDREATSIEYTFKRELV